MSEFSDYELQLLSKLPLDIALLANNYRIDILNAAEFWDEPPFPENYVPELVEIYYEDAESPHVFIRNGKLEDYTLIASETNAKSIAVQIDHQWAYIQIEGQEILNRLGGVVLPEVIVDLPTLTNSALGVNYHG
ncbi:hypothetical protein [Nostoc sp. FACHB-110]|uniref:hypothetical protein n=1 Tax=Nostoc sp. FACHB-110 TaxID=2692834 RepID=UPI0016874DD2|nr:hypothetical protein [Nostoc sp. FACHB-110]MBD2438854.1 hypothetical protein [Nostoc sp. FACHB-110]